MLSNVREQPVTAKPLVTFAPAAGAVTMTNSSSFGTSAHAACANADDAVSTNIVNTSVIIRDLAQSILASK